MTGIELAAGLAGTAVIIFGLLLMVRPSAQHRDARRRNRGN